jgi:hypothetical protein
MDRDNVKAIAMWHHVDGRPRPTASSLRFGITSMPPAPKGNQRAIWHHFDAARA